MEDTLTYTAFELMTNRTFINPFGPSSQLWPMFPFCVRGQRVLWGWESMEPGL